MAKEGQNVLDVDTKGELSEREIIAIVRAHVDSSLSFSDTELGEEREKVMKYYNGDEPAKRRRGRSQYVSQDVYDTVEGMKANLLETFAGGDPLGIYKAYNGDDVEAARMATAYGNYVIFEQNDGYGVMHDAIYDGLMARIGVAKVWWEELFEEEDEDVTGATQDEVDALLVQDDIIEGVFEVDEVSGLLDGVITRRIDKSGVRIMQIAPEEFGMSDRAKSLETADVAYHRTRMYRGDLEVLYGKEKIDSLATDDVATFETDSEVHERFEGFGETFVQTEAYQRQVEKIWVYEAYTRIDMRGTGHPELWKITYVGNTLLDKERVRRRPFVVFSPLRKSHMYLGSNFAAKAIPTQNAKTVLTRGILDHTVTTNNPRYQVLTGALPNPAELMENRFAGVVNVTRPDGVAPLPQAGLNPFVFQTIQLLDQDLEDTAGISRLSQGLNKDALSRQNSADMVDQLISLSQTRQRIIARNFAAYFVKPLYEMVYELVVENEKAERVIEVAGNYVSIDVSSWRAKREYKIELTLSPAARAREAQTYGEMYQLLSNDPVMAPQFGPKQRENVAKMYFRLKGVSDMENYLVPTEQRQEPQPSPEQQLATQSAVMQLQIAERQQTMQEQEAAAKAQNEARKLEMQAANDERTYRLKQAQMRLDVRAQAHKEKVNEAEMAAIEQSEVTETRGIASPQG